MRYGIDVQAGDFLGRYYVILVACVLVVVALFVKSRFRRYPSAKRDKRSEEKVSPIFRFLYAPVLFVSAISP